MSLANPWFKTTGGGRMQSTGSVYTLSGTNAVVSWETAETGFILQTTADLATPTPWADASLAPVVSGTTNSVVVPLNPAQRQFYRLRRP